VPPEIVMSILPSVVPLHVASVITAATVVMSKAAAGSVIVTSAVAVQPLPSVTVTV